MPITLLTIAEAQRTLLAIQTVRRVSRERAYPPGKRKLDPYRQAIMALRQVGASERDIQTWLRYACRCRVGKTTVHDYLRYLSQRGALPPRR
jgi:hypothetical protein